MLGFFDRPKHTESGIPWKDYSKLTDETKELYEFDAHLYDYEQNHLYGYVIDPTSITNNVLFNYHHLSRGDIQSLREMYEMPKYKHTISEHLEMNEKRFPELRKSGITTNTIFTKSMPIEEDEKNDMPIDEENDKQEGSAIPTLIICFFFGFVLIFLLLCAWKWHRGHDYMHLPKDE